jgi:3-oxoacyl-(acyl-carrier-protein) synthase
MCNTFITAANSVTSADVAAARLGTRFGRMDLASQLSLLAVEPFAPYFDSFARDRIAIVLAARAGSLSTDVAYWEGREAVGGLSPTLFTYTLPSAAIGEIAIRHRLTGPNLCFVGDSQDVLPEAAELLRTHEADACVCVFANVISTALTQIIPVPEAARAGAVLLQRNGPGLAELGENRRDMEAFCANLRALKITK